MDALGRECYTGRAIGPLRSSQEDAQIPQGVRTIHGGVIVLPRSVIARKRGTRSGMVNVLPAQQAASNQRAHPFVPNWFVRYHWAVALSAYTALTLAITFPAILHLSDSVVGSLPPSANDNLWYAWYPWAFRQALSAGHDPSYTHLMYALFPQVQLFAASDFSGALGALLITFMPPLAAYNVLVLLGFVLSGFTMYLLARAFLTNRYACFMVGFLYTFSTFHFWHATGQLDLATMQWLPLAAWRVVEFYRRPTWRNAVWMGLSIAIIPLSDFYLTAYFLVPFGLLFVAALLIFNRSWLAKPRNLLLTGFAAAITLAITLPLLASSFHTDPAIQAAIQFKASSLNTYSANLLSYFFPHPANPLFGSLSTRVYRHIPAMQYPIEESNYLGWVTMGLGAIAILAPRKPPRAAYFWLALAVGAFLLSLGPSLQIGGHVVMRLPFYGLIYGWPVLSNFRAPNRLDPTVLVGVCMLAGYGLDNLFAATAHWAAAREVIVRRFAQLRISQKFISQAAVAVLGLILMVASLAENIQFSFPYPITPLHVPAIYAEMAADPMPGLVLTLPVYFRGDDMFYQTIHHRGIVTGYPIRASYPMMLSVENIPYVSLFDFPNSTIASDPNADLEGHLHDIFPLAETFQQGLQRYGIRYVVLRTDLYPPVITEPWMRPFLMQQLGAPIYDNSAEHTTVWRIDPGAADPNLYQYAFGPGWQPGLRMLDGTNVRTVLQDAQLRITAPQAAQQHLVINASAADEPRTMVISLNGTVIGTAAFSQPAVAQTVDLGMVPLRAGQNVLEIKSAQPCKAPTPGIALPTLDPACAAFNIAQIQLTSP